jgi:hypothetical protein
MVTPPASWGALMVIRTGPADFSEAIVTKRSKGGAMPDSLSQREGALWDHRGDRLDTPDEESYFAALGLPCWDPADRSIHILRRHLGSQVGEESQLTAGQ